MFRDRFWLSVLFTIPVLVWSPMVQDWLGFEAPSFPGSARIPFLLGTVVFVYGGTPFLRGGLREIRDRQPGMMLLISLAIVVAYASSVASELAWFDLEFWWELALLIDVMLLGHWQEMKALGQASGALEALAALLPDDAERIDGEVVRHGPRRGPPGGRPRPGAARRSRPRRWTDRRRRGGVRRIDDHGRVPRGRPEPGRPGRGGDRRHGFLGEGPGPGGGRRDHPGRHPAAGGSGPGLPVAGPGARRSRRGAPVLGGPRCGHPHVHRVDDGRRRRRRRSNAPSRCSSSPVRTRSASPSRSSSRSPRRCRPAPASWSRIGSRSNGCGPSMPSSSTRRGRSRSASPPCRPCRPWTATRRPCSASLRRPSPRASIRSRARSWRPAPLQVHRRRPPGSDR